MSWRPLLLDGLRPGPAALMSSVDMGASVGVVGRAGDEAGFWSGREGDDVGNVVDAAHAARRDVGDHGFLAILGQVAGGDLGVDRAGCHGVDGQAGRTELVGQGSREAEECAALPREPTPPKTLPASASP